MHQNAGAAPKHWWLFLVVSDAMKRSRNNKE